MACPQNNWDYNAPSCHKSAAIPLVLEVFLWQNLRPKLQKGVPPP